MTSNPQDVNSREYWEKVEADPISNGFTADKAAHLSTWALTPRSEREVSHEGWYDAVLEANHWFALHDVEPEHAAMLLCQFNPNSESFDDAAKTTNDETGPRELIQLKQRFTDLSKSKPCVRTLVAWLTVARELRLKYHSWIDEYVAAVPVLAEIASQQGDTRVHAPTPSPVPVVDESAAGASPMRAKRRTLRDVVMPYVIRVFDAGQFATAKELYNALEKQAGLNDSPFERGEASNRGRLFVREVTETLALKTFQTHYWPELKSRR